MKTRVLTGIIFLLTSILAVSCVDITPDSYCDEHAPYGYHYKRFGMGATKTTTVSWTDGDRVCMYSLGKNDIILHKDTVEITDINRNSGRIKALVDNSSERYFAVYPYNAIKSEIGERLNDEDFRISMSGKFTDVTVMSEYVDTSATDIYMNNRFSLLKLNTRTYYGTVTIESSFPSVSEVSKGSGYYWIPISYKKETIRLKIETPMQPRNQMTMVRTTDINVEPGVIYSK